MTSSEAIPDLPSYEGPPVVEVVCGVQFKPLGKLLIPHFGELWGSFKRDYDKCEEASPLLPTIERFGKTSSVDMHFPSEPFLPRVWFVHKDGNGVIQVQRDRFLHNWRKVKPEDDYPHYKHVMGLFRGHYATFVSFLEENQIGTVEPFQYEMTYINHIPQGEGWNTVDDFSVVFPDFPWHENDLWKPERKRFLSNADGRNLRLHFDLPDKSGRLHVAIRNAVRVEDQRPIILLELTVRGIGVENATPAMHAWFDTAHVWIVRGFADLTGREIQNNVWRRIR